MLFVCFISSYLVPLSHRPIVPLLLLLVLTQKIVLFRGESDVRVSPPGDVFEHHPVPVRRECTPHLCHRSTETGNCVCCCVLVSRMLSVETCMKCVWCSAHWITYFVEQDFCTCDGLLLIARGVLRFLSFVCRDVELVVLTLLSLSTVWHHVRKKSQIVLSVS